MAQATQVQKKSSKQVKIFAMRTKITNLKDCTNNDLPVNKNRSTKMQNNRDQTKVTSLYVNNPQHYQSREHPIVIPNPHSLATCF